MNGLHFSAYAAPDGGMLRALLGHEPGFWMELAWSVGLLLMVFFPLVSLVGFLGIWAERKVSGRLQHRHGPNRVGPLGILQSLADGIKLVTKEDLAPAGADNWLFKLAPYLAFAPVFAAFLAIPFGPDLIFEPALAVGLFWMLAILSVEVIGVILAGWSSNNKWSIYGAMREACQLISYEIPLGLSILVVVVVTGSLDLVKISHQQETGIQHWLIFRQPFVMLAFVVFFVASLASNKRAPFDLPESESELVAGYHTEYSGLRFSLFYLAEYAAMFVMGAIMTAIFLGGWSDPFGFVARKHADFAAAENTIGLLAINALAFTIFMTKTSAIVFIQMWIRWTLPRPRIDQVLHTCIKVLLPMSFGLLFGSALWEMLVARDSLFQRITSFTLAGAGVLLMGLAGLFLLSAFVQGRKRQQRLSEPMPMAGVRAPIARPS